MNRGIIAKRYAKALLSFSTESGIEDSVYKNMRLLSESFMEVKELCNVLIIPILSDEKKIGLIETACGGEISNELKKFLSLLLRQKREYLLQSVSLIYIALYNKTKNMTVCKLTTAETLSKDVENHIKALVSSKTKGAVELNNIVNPEIIGGFVFEVDYRRLDASISSQITKIKRELCPKI